MYSKWLAVAAALVATVLTPATATGASLPDPLSDPKAFRDPPADARPKTRWWWAPPYAAKELVDEIDAFAAAGFGGAEVAFNEDGWGTDTQRAALKTSLEAARRNGIKLDMTLGYAWPVQSPAAAPSTGLSEQELYYGRTILAGPAPYAGPAPAAGDDPANAKGARLVAVTAARVVTLGPPVLLPAPGPNLPNSPGAAPASSTVLDPASLVQVPVDAAGNVTWDVPAGTWILFGLWQRPAGEAVMDHINPDSVRAVVEYIDKNMLGPEVSALLPAAARDYFEDSLELDVAEVMWTGRFLEEFRRRRGYDLTRYLPLLFVQGLHHYPVPQSMPTPDFDLPDGLGARVRHDYLETYTDLYVDAHMLPFQKWAKTHGGLFRTQPAFGAALDVTRSSRELARAGGIADDESLNAGDPAPITDTNWRFALDHFRSVAGGVHQGGGKEIGTELGAQFFRGHHVGLPEYKALMDKEWAVGITRPIIHGYAYQTADAGWPGRDQFSGVVAESWNHRTFPQWAMWKPLNDYWARGNMVLQQGRPDIDLAVYRDGFVTSAATYAALGTDIPNYQIDPLLPFGIFNANGGQPIDDAAKVKPARLWDGVGLERAGYSFEFLDPVGLRDAEAAGNGRLFPDGPGYRALVIDERALPGATADAIAREAAKGLAVVLVGSPPDRGTGANDPAGEDARVRAAVKRILAAPHAATAPAQAAVAEALRKLGIEPAARWPKPLPVYSHIRRAGGVDYVYLWNAGSEALRFTPSFRTRGLPSELDLWSGTATRVGAFRSLPGGRVEVPLRMSPGETKVLAFRRNATPGRAHVVATDADQLIVKGTGVEVRDTGSGKRSLTLSNGTEREVSFSDLPAPLSPQRWKLHVDEVGPGGTTPHDLELDALADWRSISEITNASGTGTYVATVRLPTGWNASARGTYLDLGTVHGALQAFVNGKRVAHEIVAQRRFDVSALLREGDNELRVVVTTTLKNKVASQARTGGASPVFLVQPATLPYGLLGPVRLVPFARATVSMPGKPRRCSSRRRIAINVRVPRDFRVRVATMRIGKRTRRVKVRRVAGRVRAVVDLRGLPKGTTRVRLRLVSTLGRVAGTTRTYRLCTRRR